MKGQLIEDICRLRQKAADLLEEKTHLIQNYNNDDMKLLKDKLGKRCVHVAFEDVKKQIEKDYDSVQNKLSKDIVGGYAYDVENKLKYAMCRFIEDVFDRYFGGYHEMPHDQRVLINGLIEERVKQIMSDLR